ncbi:MAG: flippase-like domain-containing protein [DPANN group archaeon]|nr:flippase-like domain-containing protein [DPANN group archaeon]
MKRLKSFILMLSFLVVGYLFFNVSMYEAYSIIINTEVNAILYLFVIELFILFISSIKWGLFVNSIARIGYLKLLPIFFASEFISNATPGTRIGGEPYRAYKISRLFGVDLSKSMATTVLDKMCDYVIFFIMSLGSIFVISFMFEIPQMFSFVLEVFVLFVLSSIVSGYILEKRANSEKRYIDAIFHYIYNFHFFAFLRNRFRTYHVFERFCISKMHKFSHQIMELSKNRGLVEIGLFLSSIRWSLIYLQSYIAFLAIGYEVSLITIIVTVTITMILSFIIAIPGGFGISEISMIGIYTSMGVPPEVALAGTLLIRSFNYVFGLGVNYIVFVLVEGLGLK